MRLIDADAFEVVGGTIPEGYDPNSYLAGNKEILDMIDAAPTIPAKTGNDAYLIGNKCTACKVKYEGDIDGRNAKMYGVKMQFCVNCGARFIYSVALKGVQKDEG